MMIFLKKYKWYILLLAAVLVVGLIAVWLSRGRTASTVASDGETAVAFLGNLAESASASGTVVAQREAVISAASSGLVDAVNVEVGDSVTAGQVLVELRRGALERAVASAEQDVAIAQANLDDLLAGSSADDIAAAQIALQSAQAALQEKLDGPSPAEIAASEASVKAAQAGIWAASGSLDATQQVSEADIAQAQKALDDALDTQRAAHDHWVDLATCKTNDAGVYECVPKKDSAKMDAATEDVQRADADVAIKQAALDGLLKPDANTVASSQASVSSATAQYDAAVARHEALLAGASDAEIASAEADVASAQANLDTLLSGPKGTDVTIYETRLAQAKVALQEAQNALDDATIRAPFDGLVTAVHVAPGELASGAVVDVLDSSNLEVILNVDEVDVGRLHVGQNATITLETWPDVEIESTVTAIAPSASNTNGAVGYDVHLSLGESTLPILVGMTANARLITANRENVLLVPNAAVTADRANNTNTVNVVTADSDGNRVVTPVQVTVGLKDDENTQITDGLAEGDVVLLGKLSEPPVFNPFGPRSG